MCDEQNAVGDALGHFRTHGWARLKDVASADVIEPLRARADDIMLGRVVHEGLFFQHDAETGRYDDLDFGRGWVGPSLSYRKIEKLERDPLFRAWLERPMFEGIAREIVQGEIALYRATLFTKGRAGGTHLPWHQDGGKFWGLDRDPELQIWTALDDAPVEAGCLEVLDGSHVGGLATPLGGLVPSDSLLRAQADERKVALPASAGETILIHNHLWHRSGVNTTGRPRRAFTVTYMSASTRCLRKKRPPRVFVRVFERPAVR
jgi:phytanoyl-CoA hydroxylase